MENLSLESIFRDTWNIFKENVLFLLVGAWLSMYVAKQAIGWIPFTVNASFEGKVLIYGFIYFILTLIILGWKKIFLDLVTTGASSYNRFISLRGYARFIIGAVIPFLVLFFLIRLVFIALSLLLICPFLTYFSITESLSRDVAIIMLSFGSSLLIFSPLLFLFFIIQDQKISFFKALKKCYQLARQDYKKVVFVCFLWEIIYLGNYFLGSKMVWWLSSFTRQEEAALLISTICFLIYSIFVYLFMALFTAVLYKKLMELHKERESSIDKIS